VKGSCKLCGAVIETDPDPLMDDQREQRERVEFFNRVAFHIDPKNHACELRQRKSGEGGYQRTHSIRDEQVRHRKYVQARFAALTQDNGWFQRWRLLACLTDLDAYSLAKEEEWRSYLQTITSGEASRRAPESTEPALTVEPKPETVQ
jgi:hypothetical protein